MARKAYPSDVSDEEWALVVSYLSLMTDDAPQRTYPLREVFNGLRSPGPCRLPVADDPARACRPGSSFINRPERWLKAQVFEALVYDLRAVLRIAEGRQEMPTAAILDSRTLQSTPESGARAGYDEAKKRKGNKVHLAADTLGHLLALSVTAANEQDRAQVAALAAKVQAETGESVEIAFVDQGDTGENAAAAAAAHGIWLEVVKPPAAKKGFVLLPRQWVVERSFGWMARFRRLARDYERLPETLAGLHYLAFVILMLKRAVEILTFNQIAAQFPTYGSRRVMHQLRRVAPSAAPAGRRRLMRELGLQPRRKPRTRRTTNSRHPFPRFENLVAGLEVTRPHQVWVADLTYVRIGSGEARLPGNHHGCLHAPDRRLGTPAAAAASS